MAVRLRIAGTTPGLLVALSFLLPSVGAGYGLARGGGVLSAVLLLAAGGFAAGLLVLFARRPRMLEIAPDGVRLLALARTWELPGARLRAVRVVRAPQGAGSPYSAPSPFFRLTVELDLPDDPLPPLPGRLDPGTGSAPPTRLAVVLPGRMRGSVRVDVERLRRVRPELTVDPEPEGALPADVAVLHPLLAAGDPSLGRLFGMVLTMTGGTAVWLAAALNGLAWLYS